MTTYVLVHGAWHGGWCWSRVAERLRAAGHEVFTPTLTGVGERAHLLSPDIDLSTHITDIANVIAWENLSDVVLCGHSYGGAVITGVADRMPERIAALVYLDAFVVEDGQSVWDLMPEPNKALFEAGAAERGGIAIPPIPAEFFAVNEADRAWVDEKCVDHPMKSFREPIALSGAHQKVPRHCYIVAEGFTPSPFEDLYKALQDDPAWETHGLACGHDVMVDMPGELADILLGAAQPL